MIRGDFPNGTKRKECAVFCETAPEHAAKQHRAVLRGPQLAPGHGWKKSLERFESELLTGAVGKSQAEGTRLKAEPSSGF